MNDDGGAIFGSLEHSDADPAAFARVFTTPQGADIGAISRAFGATHVRVGDVDALRASLADPPVGIEVVEAALT